MPTEVARCGGPEGLNLPDFADLKLNAQVGRVLAAWHEPLPRLLVFDNCEDEGLLAQWRPASGGCRVLLARLACFAPGEPVPRALVRLTVRVQRDDGEAVRLAVADALARSAGLALVEPVAEGDVWLHRLVAAFVLDFLPDYGAQEAVEAALLREAGRLNVLGFPRRLLAWQGHLRHVTGRAVRRGDEAGADLCSQLGYHLDTLGDLANARPYLERALEIYRRVLGEENLARSGA